MELPKYLYFILAFVGLVFVTNLLLLNYFFVTQRNELLDIKTRVTQVKIPAPTVINNPAPVVTQQPVDNSCPQTCLTLINAVSKKIATPVVSAPAPVTNPKGEYFINLGTGSVSNSESSSSNWKTIDSAQATFDAANYGNIKSATLEVFVRTNSAGDVYVRLFDSTTPAIIWGSELSTNSTTSVFKSIPITLQSGSKTYKIQMYSTLSTGYLDQARIHIVTQ